MADEQLSAVVASLADGFEKMKEVLLELCEKMAQVDDHMTTMNGFHKDSVNWLGEFDKRAQEHKRLQKNDELRGKYSENPEMHGNIGKMFEGLGLKEDGYEDGYEYLTDLLDQAEDDFNNARAQAGGESSEAFDRDKYLGDYVGSMTEHFKRIADMVKQEIPGTKGVEIAAAVPAVEKAEKDSGEEAKEVEEVKTESEPKKKIPRPRF
jgi:hypothetical protein